MEIGGVGSFSLRWRLLGDAENYSLPSGSAWSQLNNGPQNSASVIGW